MTRPHRTSTPRGGFTLVELLVVILIVAILIALLVPAIAAAVRAANNARASAEIQNMQTALADFKNKYGEYPPSRIILHKDGFYSPTIQTAIPAASLGAATDITIGDLNQRTVRAMRKYFPQASPYFNTQGPGAYFDWDGATINGNDAVSGNVGPPVILQGHECLVFFLGGMPNIYNLLTLPPAAVTGFNKDPRNPFTPGGNRTVPLFEFAGSRLQDLYSISLTSGNTNGFPSYMDPLSPTTQPRPYAYFSAYGNNGYDPNDDNSGFGDYTNTSGSANPGTAEQDDSGNLLYRAFYVNFVVGGSGSSSHAASSYAPNPYTIGDPTLSTVTWANPQSFQILSAGGDSQWGLGGAYDPNSTSARLPVFASDSAAIPGLRTRERDNITNFAAGKLD